MQRLLILIVFIVSVVLKSEAQLITTNPSFVLETGGCTVIFDASQGSKGLMGYTGDVYAHTGVITNLSTSNSDWKHVKAGWSENIQACKLKSLGNNKWQLDITPDIRTYYGLTSSTETVKQLAFVFRSADGSKEGKDVGNKDILVNVYQPGLNISLTNPSSDVSLVNLSSSISINADASQPATLKLFINSTQIGSTQSNTASITANYTFNSEGSFYIIAEASNATSVIRDSAYVCVRPASVPTGKRPEGTKDGINYLSDKDVTLSLFAKGKSFVYLLGDFNGWKPVNSYQMKKDGDYFWINLSGLDPGKEYAFQYYVDGSIRCADPYCDKILDPWNDKFINQNSEVYPNLKPYPTGLTEGVVSVLQTAKTTFPWREVAFKANTGNMVIYELHLRDFTKEGSVKAALQKLDYLQKLGVNAIELMPIQEFDGNDSWGYNPNFMLAADKAYGTPDDYKQFIDECHVRGIAVILDVVFNHTWGLNPFAMMWWDSANNRPSAENPFLFPIAMHPYNVGYDFNHSSTYTRSYFKEVLKYWLTEYHIDGYRFDLSKGFTPETYYTTDVSAWGNYNQGRIDILKDYNNTVKATNSNAFVICEHFADLNEETVLANEGMLLWGNMNYSFSQSAMGFQNGSSFAGLVASNRNWTKPMLMGYMESHDEERASYKALNYGVNQIKNDSVLRMKQLGANAAMFLTAPGPKMIWQFGELGYDYPIEYNGRTGRKPARWDYYNSQPRKNLYDAYSKILAFRNIYPQMFTNPTTWSWQVGESSWNNGRRTIISDGSITAIIIANYTATGPVQVIPDFTKTGTWHELMTGTQLNVSNTSMSIVLEPGEFRIYTDKLINTLGETKANEDKIMIYPNPVLDKLTFKGYDVKCVQLFEVDGRLIGNFDVKDNQADVSGLHSGMFFVRIFAVNGKSEVVKIVKQ